MSSNIIASIVICAILALTVVCLVGMRETLRLMTTTKVIKLDTVVVLAKAVCFIILGFFTPLTVGLAQWANSGTWPGPIVWIIMGASCMVGMAGQLLSYLSGSYSDYVSSRKPIGPTGFDTTILTKQTVQTQTQATSTPAKEPEVLPQKTQ
jgi:hypothetical protein